jgi:hypothetical protein
MGWAEFYDWFIKEMCKKMTLNTFDIDISLSILVIINLIE